MLNRIETTLKSYSLPIVVGLTLFTLMILVTKVPETFRLWNFTLFGAVGIYVASRGGRYGLPLAIALVFSAKLIADWASFSIHCWETSGLSLSEIYASIGIVYVALALYAVLGWLILRKKVTLPRILGTALAASITFFLLTNFVSWLVMAMPYERSFLGLMQSYWMAVPFYRGTLFSDLQFTALLFGLDYLLVVAPWAMARPVKETIQ